MDHTALVELIRSAQGDRSQNMFALHCGISAAAISKIINGTRKPTPDTLKKIAERAYNDVSYEDLMLTCGYIDSLPPTSTEEEEPAPDPLAPAILELPEVDPIVGQTAAEQELLDLFRMVPENRHEFLLLIIKAALKSQGLLPDAEEAPNLE